MWVRELHLTNVRSHEAAHLGFSQGINVIVGGNNSGKSTILRLIREAVRRRDDARCIEAEAIDGLQRHLRR